jgi:3-deoxy-D-manno-octulosonic acid kinase
LNFMATGAEVRIQENGDGAMLYDSSRAGNAVAGWLDPQWWSERGELGWASEGRGAACLIEADGRSFVLRHYRRGGLIARISTDRYWWRGPERTRSFREWHLLYHLQRAGLPVPTPLVAGYRRLGQTYVADLLLERLGEVTSLAESLAAAPVPLSTWVAVGRWLRRFHARGVCHADLNAHNILLGANDAVWLIDFDRGTLRTPGWWCDANLVRLRRSLEKIAAGLPDGHFTADDWHLLLDSYFASGDELGADPLARSSA